MNRSLSHFLSYVGHPLLVVTYALLILLALDPYAFGVRNIADPRAVVLVISVFVCSFLLPGFAIHCNAPVRAVAALNRMILQRARLH